ncbi:hypothetical protein TNCV_2245571 [Trichonephila clavipes]|nr:hypothetical protein TNCV_2245571 [Trichonephila clavipes]
MNVDLWSGREKKKRKIGMARKRAENREGSLGFPGRRRIPCDFQRTSLVGLALDSATSSGLGRAPRSAMQDPIQAPPGATRQAGLYTS